ncbi:hypothetical protein EBM89_03870 [Cellulomonas triticagri]|uniref:Uncharacterized protein n=1 Tax=Cellulomonas triticagri TaxID=2483352 RepID=A0A3M2JHQ1_9CELL|nr:hypothetical protein EBM89_03870 [Cellulomonas triticagri]
MGANSSSKQRAWVLFDSIVDEAAVHGEYSNPWVIDTTGALRYEPDFDTLQRLLGVPLLLGAATTTGVPALALDVWIAYELRRAGFDKDAVWPRATHPRILPAPVAKLLEKGALPATLQAELLARLTKTGNVKNVTHSSASILGKNYLKQVDVILTDWHTGPEVLISTKRMDSSYGKNAPNRVEESYGDAKNLRLRHPMAALGFVFGLRNDVFDKEPATADWLLDLLAKLGREDDAYHATCVVLVEYGDEVLPPGDNGADDEDRAVSAGLEPDDEDEDEPLVVADALIENDLKWLPKVRIDHARTPANLSPARFLAAMVEHVLDATPVNLHKRARDLRRALAPTPDVTATSTAP